MDKNDSVQNLAKDLVNRLSWDLETGTSNYPRSGGLESIAPFDQADEIENKQVSHRESGGVTTLEELRKEIGDCTRCSLHSGRTKLVFGEGSKNPSLVFVGEGPGRDEDVQGRPFVGAAGQLLDKIIGAMGLQRSDVYICNVVKCRPPNNRTPSASEQLTCGKFARAQLEILKPKVIVALGGTAAQYLTGKEEPMGRLRGSFHDIDGLKIMPTYHPAYLLRSPQAKRPVWEDMQKVMSLLGLAGPDGKTNQ